MSETITYTQDWNQTELHWQPCWFHQSVQYASFFIECGIRNPFCVGFGHGKEHCNCQQGKNKCRQRWIMCAAIVTLASWLCVCVYRAGADMGKTMTGLLHSYHSPPLDTPAVLQRSSHSSLVHTTSTLSDTNTKPLIHVNHVNHKKKLSLFSPRSSQCYLKKIRGQISWEFIMCLYSASGHDGRVFKYSSYCRITSHDERRKGGTFLNRSLNPNGICLTQNTWTSDGFMLTTVNILCTCMYHFIPMQETCCEFDFARRVKQLNPICHGKSTTSVEKGSDTKQSVFMFMFALSLPVCLLYSPLSVGLSSINMVLVAYLHVKKYCGFI